MSIWFRLLNPMMRRFRHERARQICKLFPEIDRYRVLDLGGSLHFWETCGEILRPRDLTILNIAHDGSAFGHGERDDGAKARVVLYDGHTIPFAAKEFDLVICNSVIEHVPPERRARLAAEIRRVGQAYVVQTPAFEFPLEPHFVAPLIHWLPRRIGRLLAPFTPFGLLVGRTNGDRLYDEVHLLTKQGCHRLFPTARIVIERFMGLRKSYLIYDG